MTYKLTDDQFAAALKSFLKMEADDIVPVMPTDAGPDTIDRVKTLELAVYANMGDELTRELLEEV